MNHGIVLAVLVHRDDPIAARGRHTGDRRRVLPEIAAQPDGAHLIVGLLQLLEHHVGQVGTVIVHEDDLVDQEISAVGRRGGAGELMQFGD